MVKTQEMHENFGRDNNIKVGSDRAFGIVFAIVFTIVAAFPLWNGEAMRIWALAVAGVFLITAFIYPKALHPLNMLWFRFGLLLHKIVNPLVMGLLFYLTVTPIALIMRAMGKDPIHREFDAAAESYWIERDASDLEPETMRRQF
jgi:hypothetical protein